VTESIEVGLEHPYRARVGPGCLSEVSELASAWSSCAVLTEAYVAGLHGDRLGLGDAPWIQVPRGEPAKSFSVLEDALEEMAAAGLDRKSLLVTFGGGAVSDLGGLAASLFMRGIDVVHCPTTLLAQVDAALGGKTAVNIGQGRNLAGTFHQPRAVFADTATLSTLDDGALRSGLGEAVKAALLGAAGLFETLEERAEDLLARDQDALAEVVASCCRLKARVVEADERERGRRKELNLGHTFGHAIEVASEFGIPHGVAVAVGLALALECSRRLDLLEDRELPGRTSRLLERLGLPRSLAALAIPASGIVDRMSLDKKRAGSEPRFVLPRAIGRMELDVRVAPEVLAQVLD
jgi:3-dehydroquinate synthase